MPTIYTIVFRKIFIIYQISSDFCIFRFSWGVIREIHIKQIRMTVKACIELFR